MNVSVVFAAGITITFLAALVVVSYRNSRLRQQLLELCGNGERTEFWAVFSNVPLLLMPVIFAMSVEPSRPPAPPLLAIAHPLRWGCIGLLTSILTLGWALGRFIAKGPALADTNKARSAR